jgi:hypothetical protein
MILELLQNGKNFQRQFLDNLILPELDRNFMLGILALWEETMDFLYAQPPVKPLRRVKCLDCVAGFMTSDSEKFSIIGHVDSMGRKPSDTTQIGCLIKATG